MAAMMGSASPVDIVALVDVVALIGMAVFVLWAWLFY